MGRHFSFHSVPFHFSLLQTPSHSVPFHQFDPQISLHSFSLLMNPIKLHSVPFHFAFFSKIRPIPFHSYSM